MNIAAMIEELEAERTRIDAAIRSLHAISDGSHAVTTPSGKRITITTAVLTHLAQAGRPQTTTQIRAALDAQGIRYTLMSLQSLMSRRARTGKDLVHKKRGLWTLKK